EAATVRAEVLVLVVGGIAGGDRGGARQRVADAVGELAPYARERGVRAGLEPVHPVQGAARSVLAPGGQALARAEEDPADAAGGGGAAGSACGRRPRCRARSVRSCPRWIRRWRSPRNLRRPPAEWWWPRSTYGGRRGSRSRWRGLRGAPPGSTCAISSCRSPT